MSAVCIQSHDKQGAAKSITHCACLLTSVTKWSHKQLIGCSKKDNLNNSILNHPKLWFYIVCFISHIRLIKSKYKKMVKNRALNSINKHTVTVLSTQECFLLRMCSAEQFYVRNNYNLDNSHDERHRVLYHISRRVEELSCLRVLLRTNQFTRIGATHTHTHLYNRLDNSPPCWAAESQPSASLHSPAAAS